MTRHVTEDLENSQFVNTGQRKKVKNNKDTFNHLSNYKNKFEYFLQTILLALKLFLK